MSREDQSKFHRFEVGDTVQLTTEGHDEVEVGSEGEVKAFANEERTYLTVDFNGTEVDVTEDELRRLA